MRGNAGGSWPTTTNPDTPRAIVTNQTSAAPSILITAGPTHEPIDAVRFIGNRSSGRLGISLAEEAAAQGWRVTLLLGPVHRLPTDSRVRVERFRTTADLEALLNRELHAHDVLVQAAAVADFRPKPDPDAMNRKLRRVKEGLTLQLEPTPDLFAQCVRNKRPGQTMVGFALEPRNDLMASARAKLDRKGADMVVANPLETMDGDTIEATVIGPMGSRLERGATTDGAIPKRVFAQFLLRLIREHRDAR